MPIGPPPSGASRRFTSPWTACCVGRIASLHFTVDRVLWDPVRRELGIIYTSEIDDNTKRVSENLTFDESGQVVAAEVFHGVSGPA